MFRSMRIFQDRTFITWAMATLMAGMAVSGNSAVYAYEKPEVFVQMGHSSTVTSIAVSLNGLYALSGSADKTVILWDMSTGREVRTFKGHSETVTSVAFSPDGKYALSGSNDKTIKLWDVSDGREVRTFEGHSDWVTSVAFSPDGKYILSGGGDIRLWDVFTGMRVKRIFWGQSRAIQSVAFSPDGKYALSGGPKAVQLWDISTGNELKAFNEDSSAVAFSHDGKYIVSGGFGQIIKVWEISTGKEVRSFNNEGHVRSLAFSPDGRYVISGGDSPVRLWEISTGKQVGKIDGGSQIAYSPDGRYLLWSSNKLIILWDIIADKEARIFAGHSEMVTSVAFSPDGRYAVSGGKDSVLRLWDVATGRQTWGPWGHSGEIYSVVFSPDNKYVLSAGGDGTFRLWDAATGRELRKLLGNPVYSLAFSPDGEHVLSATQKGINLWDTFGNDYALRRFGGYCISVAYSPDGQHALSGGVDKIVRLWDVATGKEVKRFSGHSDTVISVAISRDGRYALSGGSDKTVKLWDVAAGKEVKSFSGHSGVVNSVALSPDGQYALSGSEDKTIKLWNISTGQEAVTLKGHAQSVESVAFSPDGRYVLSGSWDSTVKLWDVPTGTEIRSFSGHSGGVFSVAVSPDGRFALSGSVDRTVRLWELSTGKELRRFSGHSEGIFSVAFSPDGKYALSGGVDTIMLWDLSTGRRAERLYWGQHWSYSSATFSPNGRYVLGGGGSVMRNTSDNLKLWETSTGREVWVAQDDAGAVKSVSFSSDGRYAFTSGDSIKTWDTSEGKMTKSFRGGSEVAFSPDGRFALMAGDRDYTVSLALNDYTIKLLDLSTGKEVRRFQGHSNSVQAVAFSPNGLFALSGGWDHTVKLWEVSTGRELRTFRGHSDDINSVTFSADGRHVLSGGSGGTMKLWDIATGREICTTVGFNDGEWVVITPEGYFNASKNGPAHLNVRLGNQVFGLDQFYDVFYRPDIVEAKLKGEDITTLASTNLEEALKNPPPGVEFVSAPSESSDNKVTINYKIKSTGGGIGEVRLFHNGKLIQSDGFYRQAKVAPAGKTTLLAYNARAIKDELRSVAIVSKKDKKLSLIESTPKGDTYEGAITVDAISGDNDISLAAFNRNNTVQSILKTATFKSTLRPEDSHLYVLSVGIDEYNSTRDNLKYAVKDAESIAQKLKEQSVIQYKPENIHIITLKNGEATKANIINKITALSQTIKPMDVFVLFIASHGVLQSGLYSIVTHDYDGNLSSSNLINSNEIMDISKNMKALTQIFILDTCHAGGLDNFVSGLYDARMTVLARNMGLHMFASASSTEEALDGYKGENGMFTYALLEGLGNNRNADLNRDGRVSIYELGSYAKAQTIQYSTEAGHNQTPIVNNFGKDIAIYVIH